MPRPKGRKLLMFKLVRCLILAACAAFATHASANAQVKEITPQWASRPTMPNLPPTSWDAFAIPRDGRIFELDGQSNDMTARGQTRKQCEQATGSHCRAVVVPHNYIVEAIWCDDGRGKAGGYLAGSQYGAEFDLAINKSAEDGFSLDDCREILASKPQ